MSTRPRPRNTSGLEDDLSVSGHSNRHAVNDAAKPRLSSGKSPKRLQRRQSRVPRSLSEHGLLVNMASLESESNHSINSQNSARSLLEERSNMRSSLAKRRSRSARSVRSSTSGGGVSARGGEKNRAVASEDDSWQMFKEALQNMA